MNQSQTPSPASTQSLTHNTANDTHPKHTQKNNKPKKQIAAVSYGIEDGMTVWYDLAEIKQAIQNLKNGKRNQKKLAMPT